MIKKAAHEAQRAAAFVAQSRSTSKYKNGKDGRYEARKQVSLNNAGAEWVQQDANMLFKTGDYLFSIPVHGKTDDYVVTIQINNFLEQLNKALETQQFSVPTFQRILMSAIDTQDIRVSCQCADFRYRWQYALTLSDDNAGRPETIPSVVTNPQNQKGCCKHILYALSRKLWAAKVARTLFNYIVDIWKSKRQLFDRIIRPALNDITDEKILSLPEKQPEPEPQIEPQAEPAETTQPVADAPQEEVVTESMETPDLIEKAKLHFGVTRNARKAGFVLPDGTYLDFSKGSSYRIEDHRAISILYNDLHGSDALADFMRTTGAIRVDANSCCISIDVAHEPTERQYSQLGNFIDGELYIDFSDRLNTVYSAEFFNVRPSEGVRFIRQWFKDYHKGNVAAQESLNSYYESHSQYDDDQEFALSVCRDIGADVGIYVTPANTPEQIIELGQQLHDGAPIEVIRQLSDPLLSHRTIHIVGQASIAGIDLTSYKTFAPEALEQIYRGVRLGVPIEKIALRGFNSRQIEQLVRAYRTSPKIYDKICNPLINYNQMRDIIAGRG